MANAAVAVGGNYFGRVTGWFQQARDYVNSLRDEMRKVTWPTRKQVQATTAVVIAAVFMFAFYFAVVDTLFGRLISQIFAVLTKH